jgi:hypothetical protein
MNLQSAVIRPVLKFAFPESTTEAIPTTGIGLDENRLGLWIPSAPLGPAPVSERVNAEMPRLSGCADADMPFIACGIVDAVRYRTTLGVLPKVVGVYFICGARTLAPVVIEIADQFLLLGIDADGGASGFLKLPSLAANVTELLVSVRMRRTSESFHIDAKRKYRPSKQPSDRGTPGFAQTRSQTTQTAADEFLPACRLAARFVFNESFQLVAPAEIFLSMRGRPPPTKRTHSDGRSFKSSSSSLRPFRIVSTLIPLTLAMKRSPPCPIFFDSNATIHRRCCSFRRLRTTLN